VQKCQPGTGKTARREGIADKKSKRKDCRKKEKTMYVKKQQWYGHYLSFNIIGSFKG
jgi:hypothetical protein